MKGDGSARGRGGFGRPPVEHQFQKGCSGNKKGRPKRAKQPIIDDPFQFAGQLANQLIIAEMYRLVEVREAGRVVKIPAFQAVIRKMVVSAIVDGKPSAQRALLASVQQIETSTRVDMVEHFIALVREKSAGEQLIQEALEAGLPPPDLVPHPDDIIVDPRLGTARIAGPTTKEDKVTWDRCISVRDDWQLEISDTAMLYRRARKPAQKARWLAAWKSAQLRYDRINDCFPARYRRELQDRCREDG